MEATQLVLSYDDKTIPIPFNKMHSRVNKSCRLCYGGEKCLIVELKEILHSVAKYMDGDGTVPSKSSKEAQAIANQTRCSSSSKTSWRSKMKLVVHIALHKSEEVIEKQAHFCLSNTAISHKNSTWDANSEDSQDYNSGSKSEDNTENSVVFTKDARAQTHARDTPHQPHEGFELHHLNISTTGVAEGRD
ncbi:hypothetical protein SELMODRAFT_404965 [Selaginella moellendorffii]|uniref:Uncharacterized protein n=1 Tax=Selaginella moellendorffii TaxID=88036 RepID=D8QXY2_SELML|nr:hypothetical protein SELMODRAFT_404965 [Selaginella moellendorffii]